MTLLREVLCQREADAARSAGDENAVRHDESS
jgi:hypothetical protein